MEKTSPESTNSAISLRLALLGIPVSQGNLDSATASLTAPLLARTREMSRRLSNRLCASDTRIQNFLDSYFEGTDVAPRLPGATFVLDQPGLSRALALPEGEDHFVSEYVTSYKVLNGVVHNPKNDRRTTAGVFHVAEGGLPIPDDKRAVPREVFGRLLEHAINDVPDELMQIPWAAHSDSPAKAFVSLLLRPIVVPAVPGVNNQRTMEIRFIAPGGLVSNLDFVESIFGNAGDPYLPENDASLDPTSWTGHTGCVILAPHLTKLTKKELGLPHWDQATERQRRDGMCWKEEGDLYNDGKAFKCCARDERGVIVTVVADNYFGYCKKEVKTQIGYSANLLGNVEEEHAGGARAFPRYNLGQDYTDKYTPAHLTVQSVVDANPNYFQMCDDGHAVAVNDKNLLVVPAGSHFSMRTQTVEWDHNGTRASIPLLAGKTYYTPSGYRLHTKHRSGDERQWHLVGTAPWTTQMHKPATVSGGGKSEISKALLDAFVFGEAYVGDVEKDLDMVQVLLDRDYSGRFADPKSNGVDHRSILSEKRSLGSVIKLLTASPTYSPDYNHFLSTIPDHVKELVYTVKRYYQPAWGSDWRSHFTVGLVNGRHANSLRLDGEVIKVNMLRVGFEDDGAWRLFSLRPDFSPAAKVQTEDDITASIVVPAQEADAAFAAEHGIAGLSRKYVANCERLLFQRPDDAVVRGYDKQTELDMSKPGTFISNFEPMSPAQAQELVDDAPGLSQYTKPMQDLIRRAAAQGEDGTYFVSSAHTRIVNGARSKNPRYLQLRPDLANPYEVELAEVAAHLYHEVPLDEPLRESVDVVAAGRRNNPPEPGVPALCAYNPLHYMELPELYMEFISSMTGKSPSTTGAGSEGALTKAPFNALPTVYDLNASLLSYALGGYDGWLSSAGYIGPKVKVAHDISLLIPELFSRMSHAERDAKELIAKGCLERIEDFEYEGRKVEASRLGYRINGEFVRNYFGRVFLHPDVIFTEEMLRPELQDPKTFADSVDVIVTTHKVVADRYFADGSLEQACPPLRALLEIMHDGVSREGWHLDSPEFRALFERENILASDWYNARLDAKVARDRKHADKAHAALEKFINTPGNEGVVERISARERLAEVEAAQAHYASDAYRASLVGTLGLQPELA